MIMRFKYKVHECIKKVDRKITAKEISERLGVPQKQLWIEHIATNLSEEKMNIRCDDNEGERRFWYESDK